MTATPFLLRADAELRTLAFHDEPDGRLSVRCVYAAELAKALWPDSPGWYRTSNVGYGATTGVGPKRAAGGVLKRLIEAGAATACYGRFHSPDWACYGYRPVGAPLSERKDDA